MQLRAFSIVYEAVDVASRVESQRKLVIRHMYLNPPIHDASSVAAIFKDSDMYTEWIVELKAMADQLISMRPLLFDALCEGGIMVCIKSRACIDFLTYWIVHHVIYSTNMKRMASPWRLYSLGWCMNHR